MRNIFFIAAITLSGIFAVTNLHCKDRNCPDYLQYNLPVSLLPQKDTFNIGDTLSISIHFPKELVDESGIANTFENFDFRLEIAGYRYDVFEEYTSLIFDLVSEAGSDKVLTYSSFDVMRITPLYDGYYYKYDGSLILQKAGTFALNIGCHYDDLLDPLKLEGACDHLPTYLICITNDGENNNVELVSPYTGNSTFWEEQFRLSGGFAFVVR